MNKSYKHTFSVTGTKPITFNVSSGSLPPGVRLSYNGKLSGKPTFAGTYYFTVKADNEAGSAVESFEITVTGSVTGSYAGLPGTQAADGEYVVVAVLPEVSTDVSGMHDFDVTLSDDAQPGEELVYLAGSSEPSEDDEIAEFADETGEATSTVPGSRTVTLSVWLNEGVTYKPSIAVKRQ